MKKLTMGILGFGQRGIIYANAANDYPDEIELSFVCEKDITKHEMIHQNYKVKKENIYINYSDVLGKGKIVDFLVISTMDQDHYEQTMKALDQGYDILLEKPVALKKKHIYEIKEKANELNRKIAVAHVLRYTPFYMKIKELITSGTIGEIATISQTENVGYLHYAHSYVRGNWHKESDSAPMILAKSCHDLDIITYLMNQRVQYITSFGKLMYFKKENAPKNSADYCYLCKVDCPFNAINFYKNNPDWMKFFSDQTDVHKVLSNHDIDYGKCVYKMDNDVVDQQVVNMEFENGATASFTMTAFSNETHRNMKIHGTKGEIEGDLEESLIKLKIYGKPEQLIDVNLLAEDFSYHSGGDKKLFIDFVRSVRDNTSFLTDINYSVESHFLALDAEESRLNHGEVLNLKDQWSLYKKKN